MLLFLKFCNKKKKQKNKSLKISGLLTSEKFKSLKKLSQYGKLQNAVKLMRRGEASSGTETSRGPGKRREGHFNSETISDHRKSRKMLREIQEFFEMKNFRRKRPTRENLNSLQNLTLSRKLRSFNEKNMTDEADKHYLILQDMVSKSQIKREPLKVIPYTKSFYDFHSFLTVVNDKIRTNEGVESESVAKQPSPRGMNPFRLKRRKRFMQESDIQDFREMKEDLESKLLNRPKWRGKKGKGKLRRRNACADLNVYSIKELTRQMEEQQREPKKYSSFKNSEKQGRTGKTKGDRAKAGGQRKKIYSRVKSRVRQYIREKAGKNQSRESVSKSEILSVENKGKKKKFKYLSESEVSSMKNDLKKLKETKILSL